VNFRRKTYLDGAGFVEKSGHTLDQDSLIVWIRVYEKELLIGVIQSMTSARDTHTGSEGVTVTVTVHRLEEGRKGFKSNQSSPSTMRNSRGRHERGLPTHLQGIGGNAKDIMEKSIKRQNCCFYLAFFALLITVAGFVGSRFYMMPESIGSQSAAGGTIGNNAVNEAKSVADEKEVDSDTEISPDDWLKKKGQTAPELEPVPVEPEPVKPKPVKPPKKQADPEPDESPDDDEGPDDDDDHNVPYEFNLDKWLEGNPITLQDGVRFARRKAVKHDSHAFT
jgi:hypothetical protein